MNRIKKYIINTVIFVMLIMAYSSRGDEEFEKTIGMLNCQHQYWLDYYNKLSEAIRPACVAADLNPTDIPPCAGYYSGTSINIYDGGDGKWDTGVLDKGLNNRLYYFHVNPYLIHDCPIWQDRDGGKNGVYDAGIDIIIYPGLSGVHVLADADAGLPARDVRYHDKNGNSIYEPNEEVWIDYNLDNWNALPSSIAMMRNAIYTLLEAKYVRYDLSDDFTGYEKIPFLLEYDNQGNPTSGSVKLFPEREGINTCLFTLIPGKLDDGTLVNGGQSIYGRNLSGMEPSYMGKAAYFVFPVHFEEIRRILNMNLFKWLRLDGSWASRGENNYLLAHTKSTTSYADAYNTALQTPALSLNTYPQASCSGSSYQSNGKTVYICDMSRAYAFLNVVINKNLKYKCNVDLYVKASGVGSFNANGDNVLLNAYNRFQQWTDTDEKTLTSEKFGSLNPPYYDYNAGGCGYGISDSPAILKFDIRNGFPTVAIAPPIRYTENLYVPDMERDGLLDPGINIENDIHAQTGTIFHSPDTNEPIVLLPTAQFTRKNDTNPIIWEYISQSGINLKSFNMNRDLLDYYYNYHQKSCNTKLQSLSSLSNLFVDTLLNESEINIHIKRLGVVRPDGRIVIFDFPWDNDSQKFTDIGVPIGINKNRGYRLIMMPEFSKSKFFWEAYALCFESGLMHVYSTNNENLQKTFCYGLYSFGPIEIITKNKQYVSKYFPQPFYGIVSSIPKNSEKTLLYDTHYDLDDKGYISGITYISRNGTARIKAVISRDENGKIIKITKTVPQEMQINGMTTYEISIDGNNIRYPDGSTSTMTQAATSGNGKTVTITKTIPNSSPVVTNYVYNESYRPEKVSVTANQDTASTEYIYYSEDNIIYPNTTKKQHKLKSITYPDGSWKYYEYDDNGFLSKEYSPFQNYPSFPSPKGYCMEYSYAPNEVQDKPLQNSIWELPRSIMQKINQFPKSKTLFSYNSFISGCYIYSSNVEIQTCNSQSSQWNSSDNLKYSNYYDCSYGYPQLTNNWSLQSNSYYGYKYSDFDNIFPYVYLYPDEGDEGGISFSIFSKRMKTNVTIYSASNIGLHYTDTTANPIGIIESRTVIDAESGRTIDSINTQTDSFWRPMKSTYIDGSSEEFSNYCLYGPQTYISRNGDITKYEYDGTGKIIKETTPSATITRTFDALGNVTRITTVPKGNGETTSEAWTYDAMSRITSHTDSVGKTTYTYTGTKTEIRYPDGTDQTIQKNLDGSIASVYGSAVAPVSYDYGVDPAKGRWVKEMHGTTWTMTYYNMLGQAHRTETSTGYWTQNTYDSAGRQNGSYDSEGRTSSSAYNSKNEIASQTVNGITTDFTNAVIQKNGKTVLQKTSTVYNSTGNIVSVDESAVTGWEQWNTVNGRTTHTVTTPNGAGNYTTVTTDFEGNISKDENSSKSSTKNINNLASFTSERDGLGRTVNISDSRVSDRCTYTYRPNTGQIASVFSSDGSKSTYKYADNKYEPSGFLPPGESKALGLKYTDTGLLEKIIGSSVFDALNIFDGLNRQTGLNTKGEAGSALTALVYDETNSQLKEKSIAGQKCYAFEYEADGRIKNFKKNINGTEAVKTMNYTQAPNFFNSGYTWSDGTPSVSIDGHDSFGQPGSIDTTGICTQEFTRNADSQITGVEFSSNLTENKNVSYEYRNLRRSQMTSGNDVVSYTYESGRMKVISAGSVKANYVYEPGTLNLVKEITIEKGAAVALIRDISWQGNADRISSVINKSAAGQIYNSFSYQYHPNGKIAKLAKEDGTAWQYSYDERGQLENASRYRGVVKLLGNEFAFISDSIGNICGAGKKKKDGSKSVKFTPTLFNTISTRVVGDKLEVSGSAIPEATISVNNVKASRKDNEFVSTVDANNADSAVSLQLNVVGTYYDQHEIPEVGGGQLGNAPGADVVSTVSGKALIPKSSENPVYDLGGRLVSTSLWYYFWNSEDRLVSVESTPTLSASVRVKLEFAYDHAGRRIRKQVYRRNSPTDSWLLITEHFFYYDQVLLNGQPADLGLLTGETIISHATNETLSLQYLWGLDLNGIYQGLGGIGGLLAVIDKTHSKVYLPCSDAKGTIHSYIDADTGTTVAKFAYDPYGKITSSSISSDCSPLAFSITFQSKYYDSELQSYYFGFRYYDPATCRWLNRDPLGESGGLNLYAYCDNDPINGMDYLGLAGYFFDGTENHPNDFSPDGKRNFKTNVRILFEAYKDKASYAYGIGSGYNADGTPYPKWMIKERKYESATGTTMDSRVEYMLKELENNLRAGDNVIDLFGFSRGAASATLFLNRIQDEIDAGNPLYRNINVRFVALMDQVPSKALATGQVAGRTLDSIGYLGSFTFWSPDTYARNANNSGFTLPKGMKFANKPLHLVALDEQRKEFACSDIEGALQVGFRGVHSNIGGGYGGSLFEFITREFMIDKSLEYGLDLFVKDKYMQHDGPYRTTYYNYKNNFIKNRLAKIPLAPTDNSDLLFNDNEPRHLPKNLIVHPSVQWFSGTTYNSIY